MAAAGGNADPRPGPSLRANEDLRLRTSPNARYGTTYLQILASTATLPVGEI
jgi:hypothetical protein